MKNPACSYGNRELARYLSTLTGLIGETGSRVPDADTIHKLRVASRRLRAASVLFLRCIPKKQRKGWRRATRRVTRALGEARDRDVQAATLETLLHNHHTGGLEAEGVRIILRHISEIRDGMAPEIRDTLARFSADPTVKAVGARLFRRISDGNDTGGSPGIPPASPWAGLVSGRVRDLLVASHALSDESDTAGHHEMRIAVKKLRYTLEILGPLDNDRYNPPLPHLRKLQTILGDLHDCDIWLEILPGISEALIATGRHEADQIRAGTRTILDDTVARRHALYGRATKSWKRFSSRRDLDVILRSL